MQKTILTLLSALLLSPALPARADQSNGARAGISLRAFQKFGANPRTVGLAVVSPNGQQIIATDDPPFTLKRKGITRRIWVIDLDTDLKLKSAHSIDLAVPDIEQTTYTPDGKTLLFITRRGAELYRVDLGTGKQTRMMGHQKGSPGLRLDPPVMSSYNGKMYCHAFAYDGNDVASPAQLFEVDPMGLGTSAFTPVMNIESLERSVKNLDIEVALCPQGAFFGHRVGNNDVLDRWTPKGGMQNVDQGMRLTGAWGDGTHMLYALRKPDGNNELVLAEAMTGDRKVVASGATAYYNPVLSKQATSFVVATADKASHSITVYLAQDTDGYALKPIFKRIPASVFRLSPDGQVIAVFTQLQGLMLTRLP